MHEYAVAAGIVDAALESAAGRRIERMSLTVGLFSGVFADSLRFYLELIFEDKRLPVPELVLAHPPAGCRCDCGREYELARVLDPCPACGGHRRTILSGRDCVVESLEVSDV
jgi:hydrogenase nickel incorporation protein HypA/HybF